jgi:hypothetical protein
VFRRSLTGTRSAITEEVAERCRLSLIEIIRYLLGRLLAIGTLNAIGGGYYALPGPKACPLSGWRTAPSGNTSFEPHLVSWSWC